MRSDSPAWLRFRDQVLSAEARTMAVSAPVGAGLRRIIDDLVGRAISDGAHVVILAPMRVIIDQWHDRLLRRGQPVISLNDNRELLLTLDLQHGQLRPGPGVTVMTTSLLMTRGHTPGLQELHPDLLIVEAHGLGPDGRLSAAIRELAHRARRVVLIDTALASMPLLPVEQTHRLTLSALLDERPRINVTVLDVPDVASAFRREAKQLLGGGEALIADDASLAALHSALSRRAAALEAEPDVALDATGIRGRVDALLTRLEDAQDDPRARAVTELVRQAQTEGRPCLVTTAKVMDAEYLTAELHSAGLDVALLTGSTESWRRTSSIRNFHDGGTLVATRAIRELVSLPGRTRHILWSSPIAEGLWREVSLAAVRGDVELVTFDPMLPAAVAGLLDDDARL